MVQIHSNDENDRALEYLDLHKNNLGLTVENYGGLWIGLNQLSRRGTWSWDFDESPKKISAWVGTKVG